jgi:hypothetical protein
MTPNKSEVEKLAKVLHGMHYHPSAWAVELESLRQDFRKMARFVLRRESRIRREKVDDMGIMERAASCG